MAQSSSGWENRQRPAAALDWTYPASRQTHYSWLFLWITLAWGAVSVALFHPSLVGLYNTQQVIDLGYPGTITDWNLGGDANSFTICEESICMKSSSAKPATLTRFVDIDAYPPTPHDHYVLKTSVSSLTDADYVPLDGRPSVVTLAAFDKQGKRLHLIRPIAYLQEHQGLRHYQDVSKIAPSVASIKIALIIQSTGAWKVEQLTLHRVSFNPLYRFASLVMLAGWGFLLIALLFRITPGKSMIKKCALVGVLSVVVAVGIGQYGTALLMSVKHSVMQWPIEQWLPDNLFDISWQEPLHIVVHGFITLYLCLFKRALSLNITRIVVLNVVVALGIECVQMGIPGRTGSLSDALVGMLGMCIMLSLVYVAKVLGKYLVPVKQR